MCEAGAHRTTVGVEDSSLQRSAGHPGVAVRPAPGVAGQLDPHRFEYGLFHDGRMSPRIDLVTVHDHAAVDGVLEQVEERAAAERLASPCNALARQRGLRADLSRIEPASQVMHGA